MPSGLGVNKEDSPIKKHVTDRDDLEEISKITEIVNPDEKVLLVARQSRINREVLILHQISSMQRTEES
jgi:hypothetical protein